VKHKGIQYNSYDVLQQQLGRANRTQDLPDCAYEVHMSMSLLCLVSTYTRIMSTPDGRERLFLVKSLHEVVSFLVCLIMCYHLFIERYFEFEWPPTSTQPCNNVCSYCTGHSQTFTGQQSTLCVALLQNRNTTPDLLRRAFNRNRQTIFKDKVGKRAGPVHALLLCLKLPYVQVASSIASMVSLYL
jgi:hypothetical protein